MCHIRGWKSPPQFLRGSTAGRAEVTYRRMKKSPLWGTYFQIHSSVWALGGRCTLFTFSRLPLYFHGAREQLVTTTIVGGVSVRSLPMAHYYFMTVYAGENRYTLPHLGVSEQKKSERIEIPASRVYRRHAVHKSATEGPPQDAAFLQSSLTRLATCDTSSTEPKDYCTTSGLKSKDRLPE